MEPELIQLHQKLVSDVASTNAQYLWISVTIILALGVFHHYVNIKPLRERLNEQEEKFENAQNEIEEQSQEIEEAKKKIEEESEALSQAIIDLQEQITKELADSRLDLYQSIITNSTFADNVGLSALNLAKAVDIASESSPDRVEMFLDQLLSSLQRLKQMQSDKHVIDEDDKGKLIDILNAIDVEGSDSVIKLNECKRLVNEMQLD
jgi:seryl-tRNA synthetase